MSIDLVQAELLHTLELSAALGRRSGEFRRPCTKLSVGTLELISAFATLEVPPKKVQDALTGIRTVNRTLTRAAVELDPGVPEKVVEELSGILPAIERIRDDLSRLPPTGS